MSNFWDKSKKNGRPLLHCMKTAVDSDNFFYNKANTILKNIGFIDKYCKGLKDKELMDELNIVIHDASGLGYRKNKANELKFFVNVAQHSGVLVDPTYNGKSLFYFINGVNNGTIKTQGGNILLIHTGGSFAYFDQEKIDYLYDSAPLYQQRQFDFVSKL